MGRFKVEVTELNSETFIVEPLTMVIHGDDTISRVITETHKYKDDTCTFRLIDTENQRLGAELERLRRLWVQSERELINELLGG